MNTLRRAESIRLVSKLAIIVTLLIASSAGHTRSITESIKVALETHPKLQASLLDLEVERARLGGVEARFLPSLSLGLGLGKETSENASTNLERETLTRRESSITLSQMLFDGFDTHWQREGQLNEIDAKRFKVKVLAEELALETADAHLTLAMSNQILTFNMLNLQAHEKIASDMQARVRSGKDDRAKVNQIHARLSLSLANVESAKANALNANANYLMLINNTASPLAFDQMNSRLNGLLPENLTELLDRVKENNEEIQMQAAKLASAKALAKASEHHNLPTLRFESGANWDKNLDGVEERNEDLFFMFRLRYDLFKGGAQKADARAAKYRSERTRYELTDLKRDLLRDAEFVWHEYQANKKRVFFLQEYVESSRLTREAYTKQFKIGQRSLIDLLDSENELLRAKRELVEAKKAYYLSEYRLLAASGDLLNALRVDVPVKDHSSDQ